MKYTVTIPYDPVWSALEWAKKHCPSYITNEVYHEGPVAYVNRINYHFADERDAVIFALKWTNG